MGKCFCILFAVSLIACVLGGLLSLYVAFGQPSDEALTATVNKYGLGVTIGGFIGILIFAGFCFHKRSKKR